MNLMNLKKIINLYAIIYIFDIKCYIIKKIYSSYVIYYYYLKYTFLFFLLHLNISYLKKRQNF